MPRRSWVGLLLLLVGFASAALGDVQIEWKLDKDDVFYVQTDSAFKQTMKVVGKEVQQDGEQTSLLSFRVLEVKPDNSRVLEQKVEWLKIKGEGTDGKLLEQLQGATFRITLDPKMEIVAFEGYEDLLKKLAGDNADVRDTVRALLPEEAMKKSAREALTAFLPGKAVNPGNPWERKGVLEPLGLLGSLKKDYAYVYEGRAQVNKKDVEKITFTATASHVLPKAGTAKQAPFQVTDGKLDVADAKGTIYFDAAAGRLVQAESQMNLKGFLTLLVSGTSIRTDIKQQVTTRIQVLAEKPVDKPPEKPADKPKQ
jgi:hypothetical protein